MNGPGDRSVLWLQGCPRRCPGCLNPEFLPFAQRHLLSVERVTQMILAAEGIEGVTYTGGEPMAQARGLALLSPRLKRSGLTVVCYTGYTLEALRARNDEWVGSLLSSVDILIDGPFLREKAVNLLWRGSSNQRIHFLTGSYRHLAGEVDRPLSQVELGIDGEGLTATGIWPEGFIERLQQLLRGQ